MKMKYFFLQVVSLLMMVATTLTAQTPSNLTIDDLNFFPEDIVIADNVAYVSGLGDGSLRTFNLNLANPTGEIFAEAESGYTQRWGVKVDGTKLLSILDNADFGGGMSGPAKLVEYDIATKAKTGEWDLPAGSIGHTVSIVDGKYYVTDFGQPRIFEIDPVAGTVNDSWFTSAEWDPTISGIGGTIYNNQGGFYISQGNKLWYLPINAGAPGTLQEVTIDGLDTVDADGISWDDTKNILYFATNDTGDPANVGTASKVVFSDATTATGSIIASDFDDASGLWFYRDGGKEYIFVLESQFGGLFGINSFEAPFNIEIIELATSSDNTVSVYNSFEDATLTGGQQAFYGAAGPVGISDDIEFPQFINFYDIDLTDSGLTMTLFNNSDAADLLLPDGRFDRYYFAYEGDISNINISGGSPGLADNATVTALPAGFTLPFIDAFGTGYPLPITLPNGGFVVELGGGTDLTNLGQTLSVDFGAPGVSVYNSFEDATLTGGQQAFYGAAGPVGISDDIEFPQFINFYDIDLTDSGLTMTLFNNSDAADLLLPDGRFDRYYFAYEGDISNINISGGSPGLADNATVTALPAGFTLPFIDAFGTGYPLPITLPNGGFVVELGGGTDLTNLGQTLSVDFGFSTPGSITIDETSFFPEDIVIADDIAYVSGLGDGTLRYFDLTQISPTAQLFAAAESGYTQRWGVKVDGTKLLSILDNADFGGGMSGPAKLVEYDIATKAKTGEWDLPAGSIGHTVSIVDGKYYVTDFGQPRIFEIDPVAGTVDDSWFTSAEWDPTISGIGGTIYDNEGGFYVSQGNKLWYLPISGGTPGTLQEVTVNGLDAVDADGISWVDSQNTLYYATNDTGDPANVGTVYKLEFSDVTTAEGSVIATGFDDASGLWYHEEDGNAYLYLLESQFGALFGINGFEPPFNIEIIPLGEVVTGVDLNLNLEVESQLYQQFSGVDFVFSVTNEGNETATNIVVDVTLPDGLVYTSHSTTNSDFNLFFETWTIPTLASGETISLNLELFSLVENQEITYFTQIVSQDQSDTDSTPGNDTDQTPNEDDEASVTIMDGPGSGGNGNADLELNVSTENVSFDNWEHTFFTVSVTNNGPDAATAVAISIPEPDNGKFAGSGPTNISDGDWNEWFEEWTIDELATGATATLTLDIFTLGDETPITLFAQVFRTDQLDPDSSPGNNTTGIPAEDDEAAATIQFVEGLQGALAGHREQGSTGNMLLETTVVNLSPNPFKDKTNFEIQLAQEGIYQLQIFDVSGSEVSSQYLELNEGLNNFSFDGSKLIQGFYSYRLSNHQGFISGKVIVIN